MMSSNSTMLQLDPLFKPWKLDPSGQVSWPDKKVPSPTWSSGDLSSSPPDEPTFLDLSRKLASKLLLLENAQDQDGDLLDREDFVNRTYRSANPRFKTEVCRNFKEKGTCLYGELCQFAHGKHELRKDVVRHSKYKTKLCQKYWIAGYCAYGPRCNFIHQEIEKDQAMEILAGGSLEIRSSSIYKTPASFTPRSGSFTPPSDSFTPPAGSFGKEFFGGGMSRQFGRSRYDGYKEGSDSAGTSDTDQPAKVADLGQYGWRLPSSGGDLASLLGGRGFCREASLPVNHGLLADVFARDEDLLFSRSPIGSERFGRSGCPLLM